MRYVCVDAVVMATFVSGFLLCFMYSFVCNFVFLVEVRGCHSTG